MISVLIVDDNAQKIEHVKNAIMSGYDIPCELIDIATCQCEGREMMTKKAYDIVILDLVLPFGKGEDPERDGGIKFLRLVEQNTNTNLPLQVIGLTEYEEEYVSSREAFNNFLFQLVLRKQGDNAWREDVLRAIGFVCRAKKSMLDTINKRDTYDIIIMCALREEFNELRNAFGISSWTRIPVGGGPYIAYETNIENAYMKKYRILAFCVEKSGVVATAAMAAYLIKCYNPKCLFMTGITGGIKNGNINLGDVIIADSIQDYAKGKVSEYNNEIKFLHEISQIPADPSLLSQMSEYIADEENVAKMNTSIRKNNLQHHEESYKVYIKPTVCGPFVMAAEEVTKQFVEDNRKVSAIDMEGFGLMMVSHMFHVPVLWIKGISDMADIQKNDDYHATAAFASAVILYGFIRDGLDILE